jgi:membrane protease YdiL (CAAX protease family)
MPAESFSSRLGSFVRSVLPAEPAHWLMLVGSTLLFISASLRWWDDSNLYDDYRERLTIYVFARLLVVAGATAFYLTLVPRRSRSRLPFYGVFVSAGLMYLFSAGLVFVRLSGSASPLSVVSRTTDKVHTLRVAILAGATTDYGAGFWVAAVGLVLLAAFCVLLGMGRATLPIRLASRDPIGGLPSFEVVDIDQRQTMRFVWAMIALIPLVPFIASISFDFAIGLLVVWINRHRALLDWFSATSSALALLVLIIVSMGQDAPRSIRQSLRLPTASYAGAAVAIAAVLGFITPAFNYIYDRILSSGSVFGIENASQLIRHFTFPFWTRLYLLFPALIEEIAWRGYLQPRFIRRYGVARGIFLVGLVWGAFHFSSDISFVMTPVDIVLTLVRRLYMTVALSYVLGWLTIRSRSIWPAALAHGFYNIFLALPDKGPVWLIPTLWAACGWILFEYFPVEVDDGGGDAPSLSVETAPV